jgi:hypothetical protein
MTTLESEKDPSSTTCTTRLRATPAGEVLVTSNRAGATTYGAVEIAWYPDRLELRALGSGRALVRKGYLHSTGDLIVEVRPPSLAAVHETVPGAD